MLLLKFVVELVVAALLGFAEAERVVELLIQIVAVKQYLKFGKMLVLEIVEMEFVLVEMVA